MQIKDLASHPPSFFSARKLTHLYHEHCALDTEETDIRDFLPPLLFPKLCDTSAF